jgi:acyl-CoA synthetase (AMP-forming)/AMP-acid ligase II
MHPLETEGLRRLHDPLEARANVSGLPAARAGIDARDRVGLVVPNGPEAVVAALAAECWVEVPLNRAYREPEFEQYFAVFARSLPPSSNDTSDFRPRRAQ